MQKGESSYTAGGNVNWRSHYGRQYRDYFKKLGIKPPKDPAIPLLGVYPEETKTERHMYPIVHCSTIYNSYNMEATEMSINKRMDKEVVVHIHNGMLFSHKMEYIWVSSSEVDEPTAYFTEWSESER